MADYATPPQPKGATTKEQRIIDELHRLGGMAANGVRAEPLGDFGRLMRDTVKAIVELIEERRGRLDYLELYDRPED